MNQLSKLKDQAQTEAYEYFDKHIRALKKDADGKINSTARNLQDNDVDAFRHAYVSGIFTQEYSEFVADTLGRMNEFLSADLYSNSRDPRALNKDLWNNGIGRKYGKETKNRIDLLRKIHEALKNGELIIDLRDPREHSGASGNPENGSLPVVVLTEDSKGRNTVFFDLIRKVVVSRAEFVVKIDAGLYPSYSVKWIAGTATPVSKPDKRLTNNLG